MAVTNARAHRLVTDREASTPMTASAPQPISKMNRSRGTSRHAARYGIYGAALIIVGTFLSGPMGMVLVAAVQPSGSWHGARALANNYHPIQTLPFFFGLVLVVGCDLVIAASYLLAGGRVKPRALLALICAAAFTGLITFNYVCQTTYIPALLTHYQPEYDAIVATLSLVNPRSLSWAIEMWGWGLLGLATWLVAPIFKGSRVERATGWAFALNGFVSVVAAFITAVDLGWVLTPLGLVNYVVWNVMMVVLAVLLIVTLRGRLGRGAQA